MSTFLKSILVVGFFLLATVAFLLLGVADVDTALSYSAAVVLSWAAVYVLIGIFED